MDKRSALIERIAEAQPKAGKVLDVTGFKSEIANGGGYQQVAHVLLPVLLVLECSETASLVSDFNRYGQD